MKLRDWLSLKVTDDARALRWFDSPKAEDRIARCYRELLAGYQIDPSTILKTTRMLADGDACRVTGWFAAVSSFGWSSPTGTQLGRAGDGDSDAACASSAMNTPRWVHLRRPGRAANGVRLPLVR